MRTKYPKESILSLAIFFLTMVTCLAEFDYKQLATIKRDQPAVVITTENITLSIPYGTLEIPKGVTVKVLAVNPNGILVVDFLGEKYSIPATKTDLEKRVTVIRSRAAIDQITRVESIKAETASAVREMVSTNEPIRQTDLSPAASLGEIRQKAIPDNASPATIMAQVIRNEAGAGDTFISSGFPFPPGLVTESMISAGAVKVIVDGVEVAANVSTLRGRHQDGSIRSALIQFRAVLSHGKPVPAQVIVGQGARRLPDPVYRRPTLEIVRNNNVILPSDPQYLVTTFIAFQALLPAGSGTPAEEKLYTAMAADRFDALVISKSWGTADYEDIRAMVGLWARTGNIKYFNQAVTGAIGWLPYNTPTGKEIARCKLLEAINPDGRPGENGTAGMPAEWHFARTLSYATMYLLTGYRDFWSIVAYYVQAEQASIFSQKVADKMIIHSGPYDHPRFNYTQRYGAVIAALMIDATMPIGNLSFQSRKLNWGDQLEWTLSAIKSSAWDLQWIPFRSGSGVIPADGTVISQGSASAVLLGVYDARHDPKHLSGEKLPASGYLQVNSVTGGKFNVGSLTGISASATGTNEVDYRQGMTGTRSNSPRAPDIKTAQGMGTVIPGFQMVFITNFLIDYYLLIKADPRIPPMVKINLDILLRQIRPMHKGDISYGHKDSRWGDVIYGKPYVLENPVSEEPATCYELPEYGRIIAFVLRTCGEDMVNGASYTIWYNRLIDTGNISPHVLIWQWKLFGQFYGWGQDAAWIMKQKTLTGPERIRLPTDYNSIPGEQPDGRR